MSCLACSIFIVLFLHAVFCAPSPNGWESRKLRGELKQRAKGAGRSNRQSRLIQALEAALSDYVAGFNTWKSLGRYVKNGEKGVAVLAPIVVARKNRGG